MLHPKNILITGAISEFGLLLIKKIVEHLKDCNVINLCIVCEKIEKGKSAQNLIWEKYPDTKITLIEMNLGSLQSVLYACLEIKHHFRWLDCMYLNAEVLPDVRLMWTNVIYGLFSSLHGVELFRTGYDMFETKYVINNDGVNDVFAVNVLGHFVLVQHLLPLLSRGTYGKECDYAQVIWTTSTFRSLRCDPVKVACKYGSNPYGQSKYIVEAISAELNSKYNHLGIFSHVGDPGATMSQLEIASPSLPLVLLKLFAPLLVLGRLYFRHLTLFHHNACHSLLWIFKQNPRDLDPRAKYCSSTTFFNENYILKQYIPCKETSSIYEEVNSLAESITSRLWLNLEFQDLKKSAMRFQII